MMKKNLTVFLCAALILAFSIPLAAVSVGIITTQSGGLNVRAGASTSATVLTSLPKGTYITLSEKSGNWWKVEYSPGKYGYMSADYITEIPSSVKTVSVTSGNLNVRSGPGTSYSILTTLPKGKEVAVLSEENGWAKIIYNGTKIGYVSSSYIVNAAYNAGGGSSNSNQAAESEKPSTAAVSLSVPYYSQTDSRWKYVYMGYSSKTIGGSGCTTCCIAMAESYLCGYTVYPNEMAKELSYSSSGDIYWKDNYEAYFSADYLNKILSELQNGKPVLVGAKTYSGGQHWVVVTGFKSGSVTASNFTINDPGNSSRKTLADFFASFPVFYKIVTIK